ncbi:MAG TPA: PorV/PorQ family protein [Ignavibacteriaceae bacterium]|nr:PorV/PorQ family protein [Ignavibacteriaceae bacterium]
MKKITVMKKFLLLFIISSVTIFAESAGSTGLSFLKYGFGARNIAMGDAGTALSNDLTGLFYNPAKLASTNGSEVLFMHNEWIQDVSSEVIGVKTEFWNIPFALGFNVTSVSDIPFRTIPTPDPETNFSANYFFGSLSTGFFVTDEISFGASFKYLYEGLLNDEANGFGFDFGLNYLLPYKGLTASAVIKNIGSMNKLRSEATNLPTELRIGTAYTYSLEDSKFDFTGGAEFQKYLDTEDNHFNFGGEVLYNKLIAARAGYQSGYESRGLTAGIGLMWGSLKFDYAFLPFSLGLGNANLFSLQFKF